LSDSNDGIRGAAIYGLGKHGRIGVMNRAIQALDSHSYEEQQNALDALAMLYVKYPTNQKLIDAQEKLLKEAERFESYFRLEALRLKIAILHHRLPTDEEYSKAAKNLFPHYD
jgi:hypothetical protein